MGGLLENIRSDAMSKIRAKYALPINLIQREGLP